MQKKAFTLVELVIVAAILGISIVGMMKLYIYTTVLSKLSENKTLATGEVQSKLELMRNHDFNNILADYSSGGTPGNTFQLTNLDGIGIIYINSANNDLYEVEIVACWRDKYGRIIGEDSDLDGILDMGEDKNGDGKINSIAQIMGMIARRSG